MLKGTPDTPFRRLRKGIHKKDDGATDAALVDILEQVCTDLGRIADALEKGQNAWNAASISGSIQGK